MKLIKICLIFLYLYTSLGMAANVTGYWQNFPNPAQTPVKLTDIPSGYKTVIVAFADLASDGTASFTLQGPPYTTSDTEIFKKDIKALQSRGVKVLLSIGGQNGYYSINSATQQTHFTGSLQHIIQEYNFDGLDYDFENGLTVGNAFYLLKTTQDLQQIFQQQKKTLIFTLAPETIDVLWQIFPNGKYDTLIKSGLIAATEVQLYNSGCMTSFKPGSPCYPQGSEDFIVSQADSTIQIWKKQGIADAAKHYTLGLPATAQAAGGGYVDPSVVKKALNCLQNQTQCDSYLPTEKYPELNNVMTWSINWDAKNAYQFVNNIRGF